jgi:hypothetical protein
MAGLPLPGMSFGDVPSLDIVTGHNALHGYFSQHINQTGIDGKGRGIFRPFFVREDMDGITAMTSHVYLGILKNEMHWMCREILPARLTDDLFFRTQITIYEPIMPTHTPALGVTRVGRSKKLENVSQAIPFGLSFPMEGELKDSKDGEDQIMRNIMVIVGAMMQHMAFNAYFKLRFGTNIESPNDRAANSVAMLREQVLRDVDNFAKPYKNAVGIIKLCQDMIRTMKASLGQTPPNTFIIPSGGKTAILTTGSKEFYQYDKAGQEGVNRLMSDGVITHICGLAVREAPEQVGNDREPASAMNQEVYVADHHWMHNYPGQKKDNKGLPYWKPFDITKDDFRTVTFAQMFLNCGRFKRVYGPNATEIENFDDSDPTFMDTHYDGAQNPDSSTWLYEVDLDAAGIDPAWHKKVFGKCDDPFFLWDKDALFVREWCLTPARPYVADQKGSLVAGVLSAAGDEYNKALATNDWETIKKAKKDLDDEIKVSKGYTRTGETMAYWAPLLQFIALRAMRCTLMQDGLFCAGGPALGFTSHGRSGFDHAKDVANNSWIFDIRYRTGCHVINWYLSTVSRNTFYDGMLYGGNSCIMTPKQAKKLHEAQFEITDDKHPAMYSICMPVNPVKHHPQKNDGKFCPVFDNEETILDIRGFNTLSNDPHTLQYAGAKFYSHLYGFDKLQSSRMNGMSTYPISTMSFQGEMRVPMDNGPDLEIHGTGPHGWEGPGCRAVRMHGRSVNVVVTP